MSNSDVATKLKILRGERTQKEVADEIGINQSTYAMYECGQRIPSDENKRKIAAIYHRTVQEIFFE